MRNSNPVQLVVLIVALLLGYNAIQTIPYFIWLFYTWFIEGLKIDGAFNNVVINLSFITFYFVIGYFLIKRSKHLSEKISETANISPDASISVNKKDILYITLVAIGGYILLTRLPKLLVKIYLYIDNKNTQPGLDGPNYILPGESIPEFVIIITLAIVLIAYSKSIVKYLAGPTEDGNDIDEIGLHIEEK